MDDQKLIDQKIIDLIKAHPAIFDVTHINHLNQDYISLLWMDIAKQLDITDAEARKSWDNIFSTYMRERKKIIKRRSEGEQEPKSDWPFYESLKFLERVGQPIRLKKKVRICLQDGTIKPEEMDTEILSELEDEEIPDATNPMKKFKRTHLNFSFKPRFAPMNPNFNPNLNSNLNPNLNPNMYPPYNPNFYLYPQNFPQNYSQNQAQNQTQNPTQNQTPNPTQNQTTSQNENQTQNQTTNQTQNQSQNQPQFNPQDPESDDEKDQDITFLRHILPSMKKMSVIDNLEFKFDVMQLMRSKLCPPPPQPQMGSYCYNGYGYLNPVAIRIRANQKL